MTCLSDITSRPYPDTTFNPIIERISVEMKKTARS